MDLVRLQYITIAEILDQFNGLSRYDNYTFASLTRPEMPNEVMPIELITHNYGKESKRQLEWFLIEATSGKPVPIREDPIKTWKIRSEDYAKKYRVNPITAEAKIKKTTHEKTIVQILKIRNKLKINSNKLIDVAGIHPFKRLEQGVLGAEYALTPDLESVKEVSNSGSDCTDEIMKDVQEESKTALVVETTTKRRSTKRKDINRDEDPNPRVLHTTTKVQNIGAGEEYKTVIETRTLENNLN